VVAVGRGPGCFSPSPPCLTAGVWGRGDSRESRRELGHCGKDREGGLATGPCNNLHLCQNLPTMCLLKCPKEFKF
jgi:hypothetical protein